VTHGQTPEDKLAIIRTMQASQRTAFVGDGQNDGPALAAAELGLAVGDADATARAAAAALLPGGVHKVTEALRLARVARRGMIQNLAWAMSYNLLALPTAVLGFVHPAVAAAAMGISTLCVLANTARLALGDRHRASARDEHRQHVYPDAETSARLGDPA
ncbi:HAD-IC family P-type ATPase, partial [Aquisalimonas lutea]|uniref:HAD-IC family P-type ATPase n=1 Tax=Aquisalimonas lutea TaxID=1327750 RepID=UPI0025B4D267